MIPHIEPAFGRDYKNQKDTIQDFNKNNDFLWMGKYINKKQLVEEGYTTVNIRYDKLRKVVVVRID